MRLLAGMVLLHEGRVVAAALAGQGSTERRLLVKAPVQGPGHHEDAVYSPLLEEASLFAPAVAAALLDLVICVCLRWKETASRPLATSHISLKAPG